jgi:hypothetical protein
LDDPTQKLRGYGFSDKDRTLRERPDRFVRQAVVVTVAVAMTVVTVAVAGSALR